jgi:hypothetical protein
VRRYRRHRLTQRQIEYGVRTSAEEIEERTETTKSNTQLLSAAKGLQCTLEGPSPAVYQMVEITGAFGSTPLLNVQGDQITGILGGTTLTLRRTKP